MNLSLTIQADTASPAIARALAAMEDRGPLLQAMGTAVVNTTRKHVRNWGLNHPNKLGGRRTNYWGRIANRITPAECLQPAGSDAVAMVLGPGMPGIMRAMGPVVITPGTKTPGVRWLAIPARSETYGHRPREFSGLKFAFFKGAGAALVEEDLTEVKIRGRGKKRTVERGQTRGGLVWFWLRKSVKQPQDRTLLPTEDEWSEAANDAAGQWFRREVAKARRGQP